MTQYLCGWCKPRQVPSLQLIGPPCSTNEDTEGLRGAETQALLSAAVDQRQTPTPATVLQPPPGLPHPSLKSHGSWGTQEPETLAYQTPTLHHHHTQSQPFVQQSVTGHLQHDFSRHWGACSKQAGSNPCPQGADNRGPLTRSTKGKPRLKEVMPHGHTKRKWQSQD